VNDFSRAFIRTGPIVERHVTYDGVESRVLEVDGDGPVLLLLHGFSDSADSFRPLLLELAARGRRAAAVDQPGFGKAGALGRPALESLDRFTAAFARDYASGGDDVVLVGNSMGGLVTLRAACRGDLPLAAVCGLGPAGLAYHRRLENMSRWVSKLHPLLGVLDWLPVPAPLVRWTTRTLYDRRLALGKAEAELGVYYASHLGTMRRLGQLRRDLITLTREESVLGSETLRRIEVPVLLVWGAKDRLADINGAPVLLDAVPDSRLVVMEDCGHCPHVEASDVIADLVAGLPASARKDLMSPRQDTQNQRNQRNQHDNHNE
jgi:pimeloyl-ACP methyl ester carboxylesterase